MGSLSVGVTSFLHQSGDYFGGAIQERQVQLLHPWTSFNERSQLQVRTLASWSARDFSVK